MGGGGNPLVVFEVPYLGSSLWEYSSYLIYEHCTHFSSQALTSLFERAGFEVLETFRCYERGIYQLIFARLAQNNARIYPKESPVLFSGNIDILSNMQRLDLAIAPYSSVAIWTGHNAWSFKSQFLKNTDKIQCYIDINPAKNGQFMAVSGLPIVLPHIAAQQGIEAVIVGNAMYRDEIATMIQEQGYPFALIV